MKIVRRLRECLLFEATKIDPDAEGGKFVVEGRFQLADEKNGNNRVYPLSLWENLLKNEELKERLGGRLMLGEVEHPQDGLTDLNRVSHVITELRLDGKEIIGRAEILRTPKGQILQELFRNQVPVGISSRGKGSSRKEGDTEIVGEDFELETFDFVFNPSTPGAFPEQISESQTNEDKEPVMDVMRRLSLLEGRVDDIRALLSKASAADRARYQEELLETMTEIGKLSKDGDAAVTSYAGQITEAASKLRVEIRGDGGKGGETSDLQKKLERSQAKFRRARRLLREMGDDTDFDDEEPGDDGAEEDDDDLDGEPGDGEDDDDLGDEGGYESLMKKSKRELARQLEAALKLGTKLDERCKELAQSNRIVRARYETALKLVHGVVDEEAKAGVNAAVEEALAIKPELQEVEAALRACRTTGEVVRKLEELAPLVQRRRRQERRGGRRGRGRRSDLPDRTEGRNRPGKPRKPERGGGRRRRPSTPTFAADPFDEKILNLSRSVTAIQEKKRKQAS